MSDAFFQNTIYNMCKHARPHMRIHLHVARTLTHRTYTYTVTRVNVENLRIFFSACSNNKDTTSTINR